MVENKTKLLAITHNFIGENYAARYGPAPIELEDRVVILISGEELAIQYGDETNQFGDLIIGSNHRSRKIQFARDREIVTQQPDILLLYIGRSSLKEALEFANLFDCEIHLVLSEDTSEKALARAIEESAFQKTYVIHRSEPTGNQTMAKLVGDFIQFGSFK